jgi:hypothetical protein
VFGSGDTEMQRQRQLLRSKRDGLKAALEEVRRARARQRSGRRSAGKTSFFKEWSSLISVFFFFLRTEVTRTDVGTPHC